MKLSIIIPSFNREVELLNNLFFWQSELSNLDYNILIANACDYKNVKNIFHLNERIVFLNVPESFWWAESVNFAINFSCGIDADYVLITNDDMIYPQGIIKCFLKYKKFGEILTIPQLQHDGIIYYGSYIRGFFKTFKPCEGIKFDSRLIDLTNGSCLFIPINILVDIGLFNSDKLPHYYSDNEFLLRVLNSKYNLRIINFNAIIQGPPTDFYKRFTLSSIFHHKGSPLNAKAVLYFGYKLYKNYFNLFCGRGVKYIYGYALNVFKFQIIKLIKIIRSK